MKLGLVILLLSIGAQNLGPFASAIQSSNLSFGTTMNLSNDQFSSEAPTTVVAGSNVYVIWLNNTFGDAGHYGLLFRASTNNGSSFGPVATLSNDPSADLANPSIVAVGPYVYVVWQANVSKTNNDIFLRTSSNNGTSFGPAVNLSMDSADSTVPSIAATGTDVYVAWQSSTSKGFVIEIRASTSNGAGFGLSITLGNSLNTSLNPQLVASGSNAYITWRYNANGNPQTFFSRSSDNGTTFGIPLSLSKNVIGETDLYQVIVAVGNDVYVSWTNDTLTNDETMFAASTNGGQSFNGPLNLSNNPTASFRPELAASGTNVIDIWIDIGPSKNTDIFCRVSTNNGATFAPTINLSNTTGTSSNPAIAAAGSNFYITWDDSTPGRDQTFFSSSSDGGTSFSLYQNLSNDTGFATNPYVSTTGTHVIVVWQDDTPGINQVFERAAVVPLVPTIHSQTVVISANQSVIVPLNGTDPFGLSLAFSIIASPMHGSLGPITSTGPSSAQVTYTPSSNYSGPDSFTFKASDGTADSAPGTVSITVVAPAGSGPGGTRRVVIM